MGILGAKGTIEKRDLVVFKHGSFYERRRLPLEFSLMRDGPERRAYTENDTSVLIEYKGHRERAFFVWEYVAEPIDLSGRTLALDNSEVDALEDAAIERAIHKERKPQKTAEQTVTAALFVLAFGLVIVCVIVLLVSGGLPPSLIAP